LLAIGYAGYSVSRLLAADDLSAASRRAQRLLDVEHITHLNCEMVINDFFSAHNAMAVAGCYWYSVAHYVVTLLTLVWLSRHRPDHYISARRALFLATFLALTLYLVVPTAPPRMLPGFHDLLALHAQAGWWGGDASAPRGLGGLTNELAAFPSMHAGWALWVALVAHRWCKRPSTRALGWLHALVTAVVVIGTGNHWTVDVLGGWLIVCAAWVVTVRSSRHRSARDQLPTAQTRQYREQIGPAVASHQRALHRHVS
jgi:hypothetical protein